MGSMMYGGASCGRRLRSTEPYFNTQRMLEQYVLKAYFLERRPVSVPPPLRMSSIRKARARGMVSTRTTYQCDESVDSGNQLGYV
jgi:hypothetical protein